MASYVPPVTVMIQDRETDFSSPVGLQKIAKFTDRLQQRGDELGIASIRSLADPLGTSQRSEQLVKLIGSIVPGLGFLEDGELVVPDDADLSELEAIVQQLLREQAYLQYVSTEAEYANHVTWLTITPTADPYASGSIQKLGNLEQAVRHELDLEAINAETYLIGATASLRDVRDVARRDFIRIAVMIPLGVLVVLMLLLRKFVIPIYLILTVLLTFFVTIGATTALFWWLDPSEFSGLQWTVPVLLFVLLVAVGEDYSVLLVTRTDEEQQEHGPVRGITEALVSTGGLISGAGLIMAGTFSALALGGTLDGMHQLGFALAFGMLLDTFIVRPLLVPSFQHLLLRWTGKQSVRRATNASQAASPQPQLPT